jgi:hypothetical protein
MELRNARKCLKPIPIPIDKLYDEIIKNCHEKQTKFRDELDVTINFSKIFFIQVCFSIFLFFKYLNSSFKDSTKSFIMNEMKKLEPFELKTKSLIENPGVNFCFEVIIT